MNTHEFTLVLDREPDEAEANRLYAVFADGSIATLSGVSQVSFHRQAPSLEAAIRSALDDVRSAGFDASRVEFTPDALAPSV